MKRQRMIFDLPAEIQMAIRLRAIKSGKSTSDIINEAMEIAFPDDMKQAEEVLHEQVRKATGTEGMSRNDL